MEKTKTKTNGSNTSRIISLIKPKSTKRAERESLPGTRKNSGRFERWFRPEVQKWYILTGLSVIISVLLFPNLLTRPKMYRLGDVAERDIKATHEFLVEDEGLTEKNRDAAVKAVLSVYDVDPMTANIISRIRGAFSEGRAYQKTLSQNEKSKSVQGGNINYFKSHFFETLDVLPDERIVDPLIKGGFPVTVENAVIGLLVRLIKNGVVSDGKMLMKQRGKGIILHDIHTGRESTVRNPDCFYDLESARVFINGQVNSLINSTDSKELAVVAARLADSLIKPTLTFNKRETELRKELARKSVTPFYFKVKKGEMLVREGERITSEHLLKLQEQYKLLKRKEVFGRIPAMAVLFGFLVSAMYLAGLINNQASKLETKDLLLDTVTLLLIFLVAIVSNFVCDEIARGFNFFTPRALLFAIPVASGAMIISVFQGLIVAAGFSFITSVLAAFIIGSRIEFFIFFFIGSIIAAHGVTDFRERGVFIKSGVKVGLVGIVLALSIEALYGCLYSIEALLAIISSFFGGVLSGVFATGILPLIEMSFRYNSNIKLLELANLDQPLLRELMVQAPGTYHHSVIVSNMAEASAEAINANPLLVKVAAYYHDIGKIGKPLYFIENQGGRENKHEKLAPSMSSLILISHVKDGVELARKYKLGKEIVDIIRQHHGTNLITFFYEKARQQAEKKGGKFLQIKEEGFRYPGPKPQTKEAGLIMLADAVEAASRTLVDPNSARIQGMVQKIINRIFSDGQLDECELTLRDLHEIAKSFNKTLSGIFHHRVEYPEPVTKSTNTHYRECFDDSGSVAAKGGNGDTGQLSEKGSRFREPEDRRDAQNSLKRLGLS